MKYFLIGIDGVSMKGIAKYLESRGDVVVGSDIKRSGHNAENITDDIDMVVRTSAVNPGSPGWVEAEAAIKKNIKVVKRSEFIGQIFKDKKMIAVSGMHGKTTITSMISLVMEKAGLDPTCLVGDEVREWSDVIRVGKSDWFVFEACEYDKSILDFYPTILILTNVEEEHLDSYPGGLPEIMETFQKYIDRVPEDGLIVANVSDANIKTLLDNTSSKSKQIMYGKDSEKFNKLDFELSIPGLHNIENALAVTALCDYLKIDQTIVREVLTNFHGAHRRFEKLGQYNGADIIDDYGHHPTEIKATLEGLKQKYPDKKRIVVFWPHQYKRIKSLLSDFGNCFNDATELILKPIFFVPGRDEILDVKSEDIMMLTEKNGVETKVFETDQEILEYLKEKVDANSVVLTLGIPPVYKIGQALAKENNG